jgi:hypothetical protein
VVVQFPPLRDVLRFPLHPFGQAGDYNVGQLALFQKAQQLVLEEAGISP